MNERDFAFWLQGFFELTDLDSLTEAQVKMIKEHLQLVFDKQTSTLEELESIKNKPEPVRTPYGEINRSDYKPLLYPYTVTC